jgi:serine/threonine-protein kinase
MEDLSGSQLSKYHLIERIGRGGMSDVYQARDVTNGQDVAIKIMHTHPDTNDIFLRRFEQEARIASGMKHTHILQTLDFGYDRGYPYMVTKLVTGGTLAAVLKRNGSLKPEATGVWLHQIASALDHAHTQGVIHRDLKPTNILLDQQGNAYLTDFGIARLETAVSGSLTATGNVVGTPTYMAPEQWRGEEPTPLTDVYGLGILTYLMLTGRPPFEADTPHSLMYKHLNDPPPPMRLYSQVITEAVDQVVMKALAKRPEHRYASAGEFSNDFQRALQGQPTLAQQQPPPRFEKSEPASSLRDTNPRRGPSTISTQAYPSPQPPPTMPPPVYGPPHLYQQPVYGYPPPPPGSSEPFFTRPVVPQVRASSRKQRMHWRTCLWAVLLVIALGAAGYALSQNPDRWLPAKATSMQAQGNTPAQPTFTSVPGEKPVVQVEVPADRSTFEINSDVIIRVTASDAVGVTRVEMRRFGFMLENNESSVPGGEKEFSTQFEYTPRQAGRHILEFVPFRGNLQGDSAIIEIIVP